MAIISPTETMNQQENQPPLVSIIIITYNSSKYVIETLESVKAQTYQNLELIISDDCSQDNTIEICSNWINQNKSRFAHSKLIAFNKNTGTSSNCNRGFKASKGEWIKIIAGDDKLLPNCVELFLMFVRLNKECSIVFGRMYYLKGDQLVKDKINPFFNKTPSEQKLKIYTGSGISAPTSFIKHSLITSCGGFNENYKFVEDVPMWISIAQKKQTFYFLDSFVVVYRLHDGNISMAGRQYINSSYYIDLKKLLISEILPELLHLKQYMAYLNYWNYILVTDIIIAMGNKNNFLSKLLNLLILKNCFQALNKTFLSLLKTE